MANNRRVTFARTSSVSSASSAHYTYYNKTFEDVTDLFLFACTHGDYILVYRLLDSGKVQADVANRMGKTALQLAVENEHFEVVKALLDTIPYERFRDALLLAIYLGHNKIAEFILNHPTYRTFEGGFLDPNDPEAYDDSQFSSEITPIILAAQYNRLPIVHQLLIRGQRIKKPHMHFCTCDECSTALASDPFRQAQVRLSAYKGLASDVYIALTSADPILEAFQLRQELRRLARLEHHFYKEYKKLAVQLSIFVARLLDNVRGQEELEIVLNKTGLPHEEKYATLARFDLAIQYREKPFVSHSNCQQKLMEKWYENLSIIKNSHSATRFFFYLAYLICFPVLSINYYFMPQSKIGSLCQQPNLKFKAYIASYFIFMGLIIASSYVSAYHLGTTVFLSDYDNVSYMRYVQYIYQNDELRNDLINRLTDNDGGNTTDTLLNCDISLRFMTPNVFQIVMFIWVVGFSFHEIKQISGVGIRVYLIVPSNYVDSSMNLLYISYFVFLYITMILTKVSMNAFQSDRFWEQIIRYSNMSDVDKQYYASKIIHLLYWINADRFYWKDGDLNYLAEAFFSMAHVVSICRICFLLPIVAFVGPIQVMLERLIIDISKWIAFIVLFFTAFACALYFLYSPYNAILETHQSSTGTSLSASNSSTNVTISIDQSSAQCPDLFYALINQTTFIWIVNDTTNDDSSDTISDDNSTDFCQSASNYDDLQQIGSYPAVFYFGQSFRATIITTFFTLFGNIATGGVPDRGYELITASCYQPDPDTYLETFDDFTSSIGFVLYGLFTFVCVTVLINTLIAMLEESIDQIDDHADIEWKFARSKLYMEYIRKGNVLPVPLNICPSPSSIIKLIEKIQELFKKKSLKDQPRESHPNNENPQMTMTETIRLGRIASQNKNHHGVGSPSFRNEHIFHRSNPQSPDGKLTYQIVIERIVKRFLLYYQNTHQGLEEKKEAFEFKEIKQDISSLRFEISHEVDQLNDLCSDLVHTMKIFNENLNDQFPYQEVQLETKVKQKS